MLLPSQMKYSAPTAIWNALRCSWCHLRTDQETKLASESTSESEIVPPPRPWSGRERVTRLVGRR